MHKSAPSRLLGPASRKILITKYDIMGASPAKYNTMFMQRINRCYGAREKVSTDARRAAKRRGRRSERTIATPLPRERAQCQRADVPPRTRRPRARSSVLISPPRPRFTFEISPGVDFSNRPRSSDAQLSLPLSTRAFSSLLRVERASVDAVAGPRQSRSPRPRKRHLQGSSAYSDLSSSLPPKHTERERGLRKEGVSQQSGKVSGERGRKKARRHCS